MNCPECGEEMECGIFLPMGSRGGYTINMMWMPIEAAYTLMPITKKGYTNAEERS